MVNPKNRRKRFIERHNLKYNNIHALRHTSAALVINEGVHVKIIFQRLGHSDISTTMNIYGHAIEEADKIATEKINIALSGNRMSAKIIDRKKKDLLKT